MMSATVLRWLAAAIGAALLLAGSAGARPFTIEDVLKHETLGRSLLDPSGQRGVVEAVPAHETLGDYSMYASIERRTLSHLSWFDLDNPALLHQILPEKDAVGTWAGTFSPSGKRLVVFWIAHRSLYAGIYDFTTQQTTKFTFTPAYTDFGGEHVWLSDDKVAFAAGAPGALPFAEFLRARIMRRLSDSWEKMAAGSEASVTVLDGTSGGSVSVPAATGSFVVADAVTGATMTLSSGDFVELKASPNGRFVAALRLGPFQPPRPGAPISETGGRVAHLSVFDVAGKGTESSPCTQCVTEVDTVEWTEDGSAVVGFTRKASETWRDGRFLRYDPIRHKTSIIEHSGLDLVSERERFLMQRPERAIAVGDQLFVYARSLPHADAAPQYDTLRGDLMTPDPSRPRTDWYIIDGSGKSRNLSAKFKQVSSVVLGARGNAIYVLADGAVWKIGTDGSERNLTEGMGPLMVPLRMPERFGVRPPLDRDHIEVFTASEPRAMVVVDLASDSVRRLALPAMFGELGDYRVQGDVMLFRDNGFRGKDSDDHSTSLYLSQGTQEARRLLQINRHYKDIDFGHEEQVAYSYGGKQLSACALLPPGFDPKKRYPVIVDVYPGIGMMSGGAASCFEDSVAFFNPFNAQLWAAKGYIYLFPATPPDLIKSDKGPIDKIGDVVLAGVDALIAKGYADGNRLGVIGLSQGGFAVPWLLTRTNRFKAAIALHGAVDYASQYGQVPLLRMVLPEDYFSPGDAYRYEDTSSSFYLGAPPWKDPDAYIRNSAVFASDRIQTPLMMINSDFDTFPVDQYQEMFTALYRQQKDTKLVTYWGEAHGVTSPANVRDQWSRMYAWYAKYLRTK